jgi:hypothetical protein
LKKHTCLFFDQVNIYAKILCDSYANAIPSTELSTDIVDKPAAKLPEDSPEADGVRGAKENFSRWLVEQGALS